MGKASKATRARRAAETETDAVRRRRVARNDRRSRKVGTDLADYEAVVVHGPDRLAETLIAKYTARMDRIRLLSDYEQSSPGPWVAQEGAELSMDETRRNHRLMCR